MEPVEESQTTEMAIVPRVDVVFKVVGGTVAVDHGYALMAAIASTLGEDLHRAEWLAVGGFRGSPLTRGTLSLQHRGAELRVRVPLERVPWALQLAGKPLRVRDSSVLVGTCQIFALQPAETLKARVVTVKAKDQARDAESHRSALQRQLQQLGVTARIELGERRVVRVASELIVGYQCTLYELSEEHSLRVLYAGLGGRRRFGCGVFMAAGRGDRT